MIIKSNHIYLEDGCYQGFMEIQDGKFTRFMKQISPSEQYIDHEDDIVLPGFIDIHTHGYQGCHAETTKKEEVLALKQAMSKAGVTSFLPTAGGHFSEEYENLKLLADVIEEQNFHHPIGSQLLGIHMEGPFLNPKRKGGFSLAQLLPASIEKAKSYLEASRHHIVYMALAPELDSEGKLIQYLVNEGVVVAGAHTIATFDEYHQGIQHGISASTHTGNGMTQIDRRDVGALGAALLHDDIYCEAICDFHHVEPSMLEVMFRIKKDGCRRFIMISDSTQVSGLPQGMYETKEGKVTIVDSGLILNEEGTIVGSARDLLYGFQNLKNEMKLPISDIIMMTSLNPARLLKIDHDKGSIKTGKDADFIILDKKDQLIATYVNGKCVYQ